MILLVINIDSFGDFLKSLIYIFYNSSSLRNYEKREIMGFYTPSRISYIQHKIDFIAKFLDSFQNQNESTLKYLDIYKFTFGSKEKVYENCRDMIDEMLKYNIKSDFDAKIKYVTTFKHDYYHEENIYCCMLDNHKVFNSDFDPTYNPKDFMNLTVH